MIIKVGDGNGGFTLYGEVDLVSYRKLSKDEPLSEEVLDHMSGYQGTLAEGTIGNYIRLMNKNQSAETEIIAYSPVYIMNDAGRTVETI